MTGMNPAFEMIRQHKKVSEETEALVMKKVRGRITNTELMQVFEDGLSGKYGKVYSMDPETLIGWVNKHEVEKNSAKNYLDSALLPISTLGRENIDWWKEANKCYRAFLNGVSEQYFHPCVYDRMMLDDKGIKLNDYSKYVPTGTVIDENFDPTIYKQKVLKDVFRKFKDEGKTWIYFIN